MGDLVSHSISVFMAFFAIMNPIANTAAFAGLTAGKSDTEKRKIAIRALQVTFAIILVFSMLGNAIFHLFGITLPALRLTGGILVFLVGYHMLHGSASKLHSSQKHSDDTGNRSEEENDEGNDISISPLAVPLLAGPGTIATAMNFSAGGGWGNIVVTVIAFAVLCFITLFCFISSSKIVSALGQAGLSIVTRLMGLILAVIGMQMIIHGIKSTIPLLT